MLQNCRIAHKPNKSQWYNKHKRTRADHFTLSLVNSQEVILPNRYCGL